MFHIATRAGKAGTASGEVYTISGPDDSMRAEVWAFLGFNCLQWQIRNVDGSMGNLLYTAPDWETNPVPTRSGHPILFPFPNRMKEGRFSFNGQTYQLPKNESTGQHAIHGFTPRNSWRVVHTETSTDFASITGQFQLSKDLPASQSFWPADFIFTVTYRFTKSSLRVESVVQNPGITPLPYGIGYHPYFCIPTAPDASADDMVLQSRARTLWVAEGSLATGEKTAIPAELDFQKPKAIGAVGLDHLFGDVPFSSTGSLETVATLRNRHAAGELTVRTDSAYRELLLFTPPHRKAVAIEPYTCTTDAANFSTRGIDSGWRVLDGGQQFLSTVEYSWNPL